MRDTDLLKELVDEKIVKTLNVFARNPEKKFYLTELTKITGVNVSSTFRIVNKLVESGFVKSKVIGRTRYYKIDNAANTQRMLGMLGFTEKATSAPLDTFVETVKKIGRIDRIVLKAKTDNSARVLLIGDFIPVERILKVAEDIKVQTKFEISFVELNTKQFERLYGFEESMRTGQILYRADKE